jgi:hypothetical protein
VSVKNAFRLRAASIASAISMSSGRNFRAAKKLRLGPCRKKTIPPLPDFRDSVARNEQDDHWANIFGPEQMQGEQIGVIPKRRLAKHRDYAHSPFYSCGTRYTGRQIQASLYSSDHRLRTLGGDTMATRTHNFFCPSYFLLPAPLFRSTAAHRQRFPIEG